MATSNREDLLELSLQMTNNTSRRETSTTSPEKTRDTTMEVAMATVARRSTTMTTELRLTKVVTLPMVMAESSNAMMLVALTKRDLTPTRLREVATRWEAAEVASQAEAATTSPEEATGMRTAVGTVASRTTKARMALRRARLVLLMVTSTREPAS
jgi:hypothetical protein